MTREDIIRMAREAGAERNSDFPDWSFEDEDLERFAALVAAAEREKVARWMMERGYSTGHGDTTEDLLQELDWQIAENWNRALINGITTEREACAKVCDEIATEDGWEGSYAYRCVEAIRARGQG
jgi:hypothetical protein